MYAASFVDALQHACGIGPVVLGKPSASFAPSVLEMIGCIPEQSGMVGDDITRYSVYALKQAGAYIDAPIGVASDNHSYYYRLQQCRAAAAPWYEKGMNPMNIISASGFSH